MEPEIKWKHNFDAGTDCGYRTQTDSLSSPGSCGIKQKMKEQPVHQKRKTHHTKTEPLPRAININDLEHGKDSASLRSPSPLSRYQAFICERLNVFVYFLCIQLCDLNFYFRSMYSYVFMCTRLCFCLLCSYTVCPNKLQYTKNIQIQLLYLGLSLQPRK